MSRIFISYKRVDKEKVFKLKDQIESTIGEKCWIDIDGIESDAQFKNVIIRAINDCEVLLFMYSKAHLRITDFGKDWTIRELSFAESKNKRIVFVNIDGSLLSDEFVFDFGTKQQIDGQSNDAVNRLIRDLEKWLSLQVVHTHSETQLHAENNNNDRKNEQKDKGNFSITANAALQKKGCTVAVSVAFMLFLIFLPLKFMLFDSGVNTSNGNEKATLAKPAYKLESVDLALPSGTLWADRNIGCESPKDCSHLAEQDGIIAEFPDLSKDWQLPTKEQFEELREYCTWEWLDDCHGYDIVCRDEQSIRDTHQSIVVVFDRNNRLDDFHGYKITGKNGKSIYLPASGYDVDHQFVDFGIVGRYWIEGDVSEEERSIFLQFNRERILYDESPVDCSYSIRPVKKN